MEATKLVRMVNQISVNWDCGPDKAKAIAGVVDHLRRFWSPIMLDELAEHIAVGDAGLSPIAEQALNELLEERRAAS